ncbi:protein YIPF3-like isoform X2 [Gigantopelta aegis]|uniref:protein YIPF3-like isoform X2 n=1 Tax=Gigantopelta aegis TaxID=1735272 RepID=UPI001B88DFD3|nr:protein YIPF3-like isoform X2 [Gigantopelta aegis]
MADSSPWTDRQHGVNHGSAVLDMQMEDDASDYETNITDSQTDTAREGKPGKFMDDVRQRVSDNMTDMVWQAGKQGAKRAWSLYGNIDILRPYFDVEPKEVQKRLLFSLMPSKPTSERQRVPKELYGPTMVIFTLVALLLFQMKTAEHKVEEGTLMGSAFIVCFTYWFGASGFVWFLSYVCNIRIAMLQILSMLGYGLFGHCIVLFLGTVIHTSHDHMFFYFMWGLVGGLTTLKMACVIYSRSSGRTERMIVIAAIAALHLLFLLYLHFAYHTIVEEISDALRDKVAPQPAEQEQVKMNVEKAAEDLIEKVTKRLVY